MILLDANILLEMLIAGRPSKNKVIRWFEENEDDYCISMLTVHLVLHFGLKDGLGVSDLKTFLADYPKIALIPDDYVAALEVLRDDDHEDALQLAGALRSRCSAIVTLDGRFANTYKDKIKFILPD